MQTLAETLANFDGLGVHIDMDELIEAKENGIVRKTEGVKAAIIDLIIKKYESDIIKPKQEDCFSKNPEIFEILKDMGKKGVINIMLESTDLDLEEYLEKCEKNLHKVNYFFTETPQIYEEERKKAGVMISEELAKRFCKIQIYVFHGRIWTITEKKALQVNKKLTGSGSVTERGIIIKCVRRNAEETRKENKKNRITNK